MSEKRCSKCGESKPLSEFYRRSNSRDGHMNQCKACRAEAHRAWREANRERHAETGRAYYAANRERKAETQRAWRKANRERKAEIDRAWRAANPDKVAKKGTRSRAKHPDRHAARLAVSNAVKLGKLPAASTQVCAACGESAQNWHHYLGYAPEHRLDVVAVCRTCHIELHKETN